MNRGDKSSVQLLVSVRDANEAESALAGGADWIDLKEPSAGPLGAVEPAVAARVAAAVASRASLSAAGGELLDWSESQAQRLLDVDAVSIIKLGLSGCGDQTDWRRMWLAVASEAARSGKRLATVAYADFERACAPTPGKTAAFALECGAPVFLLDTWDKSGPSLVRWINPQPLAETLRSVRQRRIMTVVAGRLTTDEVQKLPLEVIDVVAVRGAVCEAGRSGTVSARRVADLREKIAECGKTVGSWRD